MNTTCRIMLTATAIVCAPAIASPATPGLKTGFSLVPAPLAERWNDGDLNAVWVGDSISSLSYIGSQSSLYIGMAQAHPNVVGIQSTVATTLPTSRAAHRMQFNVQHTVPSQTLGQPGRRDTNRSAGGAEGYLPVHGQSWFLSPSLPAGQPLSRYEFLETGPDVGAGDIAHPNWWSGERVRCDWIFYREAASNPASVRIRAAPEGLAVSDVSYSLDTLAPLQASPDIAATFASTSGDGLALISQIVNDPERNPVGRTLSVEFLLGGQPGGIEEVRYASPFLTLADAEGARFWNAGFGGWRSTDHARETPSAMRFYTSEAVEQFVACVAATGDPLNTIVLKLGANDGQLSADYFATHFTAIIDRWAAEMAKHTDDELMALLITPYVFSDDENGFNTPDRVQEAIDLLRETGTSRLDGDRIGFVNLKAAVGGLWFEDVNPDWPAAPGDVHPSPVGAHELALLVQSAFTASPCPPDLTGDGAVSAEDLAAMLGAWGGPGVADLDGSGAVGTEDLAALLAAWGECP